MRNLLAEIKWMEENGNQHDEARWGADMLGRAIGHEMARDNRLGLPATLFYSNLIHQVIPGATHKIMAFTAAREVMSA
jgi:hypothetical protein